MTEDDVETVEQIDRDAMALTLIFYVALVVVLCAGPSLYVYLIWRFV